MEKRLVWIHEDALGDDHPVRRGAGSVDDVWFVWDEHHLESMGYGAKRLVFIYETLCEMGVSIVKGRTATVLTQYAAQQGYDTIWVPESVSPALQAIIEELRAELRVEVVADTPLVQFERPPNLRRFFSYWKTAGPRLMRP